MTCSNVRRMKSADAAYEWKLWLRTRQTSTFPSSAVASFSSSLKLVIIRYESFHSVHYALRRRRPDKLNIFLAQGKGNEREIYGDSMRTSIKLIVMVVTLWADYLLLFFCWWKDENSFRAFHHLHPKIGRKTMPTEASSEYKTACRIPEQSKRKAINRGIEGEARWQCTNPIFISL